MTPEATRYQNSTFILIAIASCISFLSYPLWGVADNPKFFGLALGLIFGTVRFKLRIRASADFGYVSARKMAASRMVSHLMLFCPAIIGWAYKEIDIYAAGIGTIIPVVCAIVVALYMVNTGFHTPEANIESDDKELEQSDKMSLEKSNRETQKVKDNG